MIIFFFKTYDHENTLNVKKLKNIIFFFNIIILINRHILKLFIPKKVLSEAITPIAPQIRHWLHIICIIHDDCRLFIIKTCRHDATISVIYYKYLIKKFARDSTYIMVFVRNSYAAMFIISTYSYIHVWVGIDTLLFVVLYT